MFEPQTPDPCPTDVKGKYRKAFFMRQGLIALISAIAWLCISPVSAQTPEAPPSSSASQSASSQASTTPAPTLRPRLAPSAAPGPSLSRGPELDVENLEAFTDSIIPAFMQRDHVLGVTLAVVQGKTPLLIKGYGYDRLSPARRVDPNSSLFRLGSMTKTFTWIAVRQEIEAGRLSLDKPVASVLPPEIFKEDRRYQPILLRHLMSHSAGFDDTSLGHLFQPNQTSFEGVDSYMRRYKPRRIREPGLFASYSNYGAELAARAAVESSHSKDVPSLVEARIFKPLGLDRTTLREPFEQSPDQPLDQPAPLDKALARDLSTGFVWDGASYIARPFDHSSALSGALGGSSTASDMARYMSLLLGNGELDGVVLYSPESAQAFRTPLLKVPQGFNGWASGLMMRDTPQGYKTFGHRGSTLWFSSNLVIIPELDLAIFIAANTQTGETLTESFPDLLLSRIKGGDIRPPLIPAPEQAYAQNEAYYKSLKGDYVSTRRAYGGLEGAITRLINTVQVSFEDDGRLIMAAQDNVAAFVPTGQKGFFAPQESEDAGVSLTMGALHFLPKPDGNGAIGFETATNMSRFERVGWIHKPATLAFMTSLVILTCVFSLIGMGRNHHNLNRPTPAQIRATWISYGIAAGWILGVATFDNWRAHIGDDPVGLFTQWPNGEVRLASFLVLLASLGTLFQLGTLYWIFKPATHYLDGWADWQKAAHVLLNLVWASYVIVLVAWNALEFWN